MYSSRSEAELYSTCRTRSAALLAVSGLALALACLFSASAFAATYSQTRTMPVPPASNFAGAGGGDGWAVSLSQDQVYNVFHHNNVMTVACHLQADASECWSPTTVRDPDGGDFSTSGQPGMSLDDSSGKLYVYGTRNSDSTSGVVCFDPARASSDPFCGFTALTGTGEGQIVNWSTLSVPMQVGHRWYAFNYVSGDSAGGAGGDGSQNRLLCFDLTTDAACAGQPFAVDIGAGSVGQYSPSPTTAAIGDTLVIPIDVDNTSTLACFDASTQGDCAGAWPVQTAVPSVGANGSPFPLMDATGTITGFCLPTGADPCFTLSGASAPTPDAMQDVIGASSPWNGPGLVLGPRVYVPNGQANQVQCYDYSTSASCSNFPKSFTDLYYLYTVNADPQRPTCLWANADGGGAQIQSFDAYTGGACGSGSTRVLTSQFVVPQQTCFPTAYESLQVVSPDATTYTGGTVEFADGAGNPIAGVPTRTLDSGGAVDLSGLALNTDTGLPQFLITLTGTTGDVGQLVVKLTWTDSYDPACVAPGAEVQPEASTVTTSPSDGPDGGAQLTVPEGTPVTDSTTLAGPNSGSASGTVTYTWYSDSSCSTVASAGRAQAITTPGTLPDSEPVILPAGTYRVIASYSGDDGNLASASACADKVLTVRSSIVAPQAPAGAAPTAPVPASPQAPAATAPTEPVPAFVPASCVSRRFVTIHVSNRYKNRRIRSLTGTSDGKRLHVDRTHGRWAVTVDLRGRPRATVVVKLRLTFGHGPRTNVVRAFRTCRHASH